MFNFDTRDSLCVLYNIQIVYEMPRLYVLYKSATDYPP